MSIFDSIFGDSKQDIETKQEPWGPQAQFLQDIFNQAQQWYQQPRQYAPPFSSVAPLNQYQISGMEGLANYAQSPALQGLFGSTYDTVTGAMDPSSNPYLGAAFQAYKPSQGYLTGLMNRANSYDPGIGGNTGPTDVYNQMMTAQPNMDVWGPVMDTVTNRATQNWKEQILPSISSAVGGSGQYMSDPKAQQAVGLAGGRFSEALQGTLAGLGQTAASEALADRRYGAQGAQTNAALGLNQQIAADAARQGMFGQGLNAAQTGLGGFNSLYSPSLAYSQSMTGMAPNLAQMGAYPYSLMSNVGQQYQAQGQADLADIVNRWNMYNQGPLSDLGAYQGLVSGNYGGTSTTPSYTNPLGNALSLGLMGTALFGNLGALGAFGAGGAGAAGAGAGAMTGANGASLFTSPYWAAL